MAVTRAHSRMEDVLSHQCWEACCQVLGQMGRSTIMAELFMFNFCHLPGPYDSDEFTRFVKWLSQEPVGLQFIMTLPILILLVAL